MIVLLRTRQCDTPYQSGRSRRQIFPSRGDRVQLQQVLMNLMINGIDAMKTDGTRELIIKSQRAESGQVLVSVSDTGAGLPPQQADQIFDAFFTTKQHGTGMGFGSADPSLNRMRPLVGCRQLSARRKFLPYSNRQSRRT